MEFLFDPAIWISLLTLVVLEIILGIDNLVFIAILAAAAPARPRAPDRPRARTDHGGGLFLVFKGTMELHERLEGTIARTGPNRAYAAFWLVVSQIVAIDAVFSLDSVITAVGMVDELAELPADDRLQPDRRGLRREGAKGPLVCCDRLLGAARVFSFSGPAAQAPCSQPAPWLSPSP